MMPIYLSKNFTEDEFKCHCGQCEFVIDMPYINKMQAFRDDWGKPMSPTSGHRCQEYNKLIGGVSDSLHIPGKAGDWSILSPFDRYRFIRLSYKHGFTGIGVYSNFIHLDTRNDRARMWVG